MQQLARGPASVSEFAKPFDMALPKLLQLVRVLDVRRLIAT
jgi:hypothetical protein